MLVPFDNMPKEARIWIYQAERPITLEEKGKVMSLTSDFIRNWSSHNIPVTGSYCIRHEQFLIITADDTNNLPSGCSIDSSVGLIRSIEEQLRISFLDRTKVAIQTDGKVFMRSFNELKGSVQAGEIKSDDLVFDNSIQRMKQLDSEWLVPAGNSWLNKYF